MPVFLVFIKPSFILWAISKYASISETTLGFTSANCFAASDKEASLPFKFFFIDLTKVFALETLAEYEESFIAFSTKSITSWTFFALFRFTFDIFLIRDIAFWFFISPFLNKDFIAFVKLLLLVVWSFLESLAALTSSLIWFFNATFSSTVTFLDLLSPNIFLGFLLPLLFPIGSFWFNTLFLFLCSTTDNGSASGFIETTVFILLGVGFMPVNSLNLFSNSVNVSDLPFWVSTFLLGFLTIKSITASTSNPGVSITTVSKSFFIVSFFLGFLNHFFLIWGVINLGSPYLLKSASLTSILRIFWGSNCSIFCCSLRVLEFSVSVFIDSEICLMLVEFSATSLSYSWGVKLSVSGTNLLPALTSILFFNTFFSAFDWAALPAGDLVPFFNILFTVPSALNLTSVFPAK